MARTPEQYNKREPKVNLRTTRSDQFKHRSPQRHTKSRKDVSPRRDVQRKKSTPRGTRGRDYRKRTKREKEGKSGICCILFCIIGPIGWGLKVIWAIVKWISWWALIQFGVLFGIGFGIVFLYLHGTFTLASEYSVISAGCFGVFFACLLFFSKKARCISALSFLEMFSTYGRFCLYTFIGWMVATYPISNSMAYGKATVSGGACIGNAALVQVEVVHHELLEYQAEIIDQLLTGIDQFVKPIENSVNKVDSELQKWEEKISSTVDRLEVDCQNSLGPAFKKCKEGAGGTYSDCKDLLGKFEFVCKPVDWGTSLCASLENLKLCSLLKPTYGLTTIIKFFRDTLQDIKTKLQVELGKRGNVTTDQNFGTKLNEMNANMTNYINEKGQFLEDGISLLHVLALTIPVLLIPLSAHCFFIRKIQSEETGKEMADSWVGSFNITGTRRYMVTVFKTLFVIGKMFFHFGIFAFEFAAFFCYSQVSDFAANSFNFSGSFEYKMNVNSSNLLSTAVSTLFPGVDARKNYSLTLDASVCMPPVPDPTPFYVYMLVVGLYVGLIIATICSSKCLSYRHDVYEWFYDEEE